MEATGSVTAVLIVCKAAHGFLYGNAAGSNTSIQLNIGLSAKERLVAIVARIMNADSPSSMGDFIRATGSAL